MAADAHLSLVLPILNGADRLAAGLPCVAAWIQRQRERVELILVDDGSAPATRDLLHSFAADTPNVTVLVNGRNHGKGHAVARGVDQRAVRFGAYSLNAVERILAVQAQPKGVLDTLADQERRRLPPHLRDNPVSPRPTTDYQHLVEPATAHEPPSQIPPKAADSAEPLDGADRPA